ncbi:hypothetical protein WAF17_08580 [Bernardetia sp. ABR2-2B]|uniref:hypothetical protein n=1 Tax=Bernardetia sp. ABR2-2B TaxID=3127472 RepID=UPI0030D02391
MLHRLFYRLKYSALSSLFAGILLLFFQEMRTYGIYAVVGGILLYFLFGWLEYKTQKKHSYPADENGNAKPTYR